MNLTAGLLGMYVGAMYCEHGEPTDWHRAKVLAFKSTTPTNGTVTVIYVDYGTICEVVFDDIRLLPKAFAKVPCQAIRVDLGVVLPHNEVAWTAAARERFKVQTGFIFGRFFGTYVPRRSSQKIRIFLQGSLL